MNGHPCLGPDLRGMPSVFQYHVAVGSGSHLHHIREIHFSYFTKMLCHECMVYATENILCLYCAMLSFALKCNLITYILAWNIQRFHFLHN